MHKTLVIAGAITAGGSFVAIVICGVLGLFLFGITCMCIPVFSLTFIVGIVLLIIGFVITPKDQAAPGAPPPPPPR